MLDLQEIEILAQLLDNIDIAIKKMEKSYKNNDGEIFSKGIKEIIDSQNKISMTLK